MIPKVYAHQGISIAFGSKLDRMMDTSDPGTGKTRVQAELFAKRRKKEPGCMLVVATKSTLKAAWADDFAQFTPHLRVVVATAENREKAFATEADVYITNTDAAVWLAKQPKGFFKKFNTLVIDEITKFKHPTSQRSRAMAKIRQHFKYRSGLTGTPNPRSITDIWHPYLLIDDGVRLGKSFYGFRAAVCTPQQVGPNANMVEWVDKPGAENAVAGLVADITIRHVFENCIDIPEHRLYARTYSLTTKQKKTYLEMEKTQLTKLNTGSVTAINAAAVATKLLQIASGAVYNDEGKYSVVDTGRYELVLDLVEERQHSIVFFLWGHQREQLVKEAEKRGVTFCVLDGSTSQKERDEMIKHYQAGFYQAIFAHPASAAHGITLTRATAAIWASPTYDLELFVQGNKRHYRAGQKQKTETIVVIAEGTMDERAYARCEAKGERMTNLLEMLEVA